MENFSTSNMNTRISSAMEFIDKPQVFNTLVNNYPTQYELGWLKHYGLFEEVKGETYNWHEEIRLLQAPIIASIAQIGATNGMRITLAAASHTNSGATSYPRVNQIVRLRSGHEGLIRSKNISVAGAHTIDVYPVKNSITYATFSTGVAATQQFFLPSNAFTEITDGMQDSIANPTDVYSNQLQKFSEVYTISFNSKSNETWIDFTNPKTGEKGKSVFYRDAFKTEVRFMHAEETQLFLGQKSETGLVDVNGNPVKTTEGMIETLDQRGTGLTYDGTINTLHFENAAKLIRKNHGVNKHVLLMGQNYDQALTRYLVDFTQNGGVKYANEESDKIIDASFGRFKLGSYTYDFKPLGILSHPELAGVDGFTYADRCIMMPDPKIKVFSPKTNGGTELAPFTVMYKNQGIGSESVSRDGGKFAMAETGFYAKGGATNTKTVKQITYYSDKGARLVGAQQFINITKSV